MRRNNSLGLSVARCKMKLILLPSMHLVYFYCKTVEAGKISCYVTVELGALSYPFLLSEYHSVKSNSESRTRIICYLLQSNRGHSSAEDKICFLPVIHSFILC